jgi:hypothetical protein
MALPAHASRSFARTYSTVPWSPLRKFFATRRLTRVACTRSSSSMGYVYLPLSIYPWWPTVIFSIETAGGVTNTDSTTNAQPPLASTSVGEARYAFEFISLIPAVLIRIHRRSPPLYLYFCINSLIIHSINAGAVYANSCLATYVSPTRVDTAVADLAPGLKHAAVRSWKGY